MLGIQRNWVVVCCSAVACLATSLALADEKKPMTDAELDAVTAGSASTNSKDELLTFEVSKRTRLGKTVTAEGDLQVVESLRGITIGNLVLSDQAQSNLQSIININAVNSSVNVLLNLNVSIDSAVGAVNQLNLNTPLPNFPPRPGN